MKSHQNWQVCYYFSHPAHGPAWECCCQGDISVPLCIFTRSNKIGIVYCILSLLRSISALGYPYFLHICCYPQYFEHLHPILPSHPSESKFHLKFDLIASLLIGCCWCFPIESSRKATEFSHRFPPRRKRQTRLLNSSPAFPHASISNSSHEQQRTKKFGKF